MKNYSDIVLNKNKNKNEDDHLNIVILDFQIERKILEQNKLKKIKYSEDKKNFMFWIQYWEKEFLDLKYEINPLITNKKNEFSKFLYFLYRSRDRSNEYNKNFLYPILTTKYYQENHKNYSYTVANVTRKFAIDNNIPILLSSYKPHNISFDFSEWYYKHTIE
jgi:hypothetical protein